MRLMALPAIMILITVGTVCANDLSSDDAAATERIAPRRFPPEPPPPPCCPPPYREELSELVSHVSVGEPERHGGLQVYPLIRERGWADPLTPRTLDEAIARGCLRLHETPGADVNQLLAANRCGEYVFLMTGELLAGGKQDRFVAEDGLLPPHSHETWIPVYCSERGRWDPRPIPFKSSAGMASPTLRRKLAERASQEDVWRDVDAEARARGAASDTGRYGEIFDRNASRVREAVDSLCGPLRRRRSAIGAVFVHGGRIVGADLFGGVALFRAELPKLVASYALGAPFEACRGCWPSVGEIEAFVRSFASASATELGTYGVGRRYRSWSDRGSAEVLAFSGEVVHARLDPGRAFPLYDAR